jgi:UDP-N-acetylmuramoyl-tripeptide--D-alanyl-D-alanine ligase
MNLNELCQIVNGELIGDNALIPCDGFPSFSSDTRTIEADSVFIALSGENFDGHKFLPQAKRKRACAAIVTESQTLSGFPQIVVKDTLEAYGLIANYWRNILNAKVVAITGSCGKTTVKGLLSSIFAGVGRCFSTRANYNNQIGVPQTILNAPKNCEYLVVEAGTSEQGEIAKLAKIIDADVAVVINVNAVHLDGLLTLEGVANEKSDLFAAATKQPIAVMNGALRDYPVFVEKTKNLSCLTFSSAEADEEIDICAKNLQFNDFGCACFNLVHGEEQVSIQLKVSGEHQVENALAAATAAIATDVSLSDIKTGLEAYQGENRRMQRFQLKRMQLIDDSYNASPASVRAAIDVLSTAEFSVLVLGDMLELGSVTRREHEAIGHYAREKGIHCLVCYGDESTAAAGAFGNSAFVFSSHKEIVDFLRFTIQDGATILVKGSRGLRMDIVVDSLLQHEGNN